MTIRTIYLRGKGIIKTSAGFYHVDRVAALPIRTLGEITCENQIWLL
ncbi:hypothetical protein [Yersinia mollaretii]|nr:hypothetical protein [Yersinia mollaretii]